MGKEYPRYNCPVCGDPDVYMLWVDPRPPEGCPDDMAWQTEDGGTPVIRNVSECARQMKAAWQAAEFRKLVPDAFDENGIMKDGRLADVINAFANKHPNKPLVIG